MRILQLTEMGDFLNYFLVFIVALIAESLAGEYTSGSGVLESMPEYTISPTESLLHPSHIYVSISPPEEVLREGPCFLSCVLNVTVSSPSDILLLYILRTGS